MSKGSDTVVTITSTVNPGVKRVVRLRERSHRDQEGVLLIEGARELARALDAGHAVETLFFCSELFRDGLCPVLVERCAQAGACLLRCSEAVFQKMAYRRRPEGVLAVASRLGCPLEALTLGPAPLLLIVEAVEKPGNLGTMLRSADAAGCNAVVVCDGGTDINNPNVVRASVGACFAVPLVETPSAVLLPWLAARGITVAAATPHADRLFTEPDWRTPTAIVVGAEPTGLSEIWLKAATVRIRIPMLGRADSLNVSAAATLLLYEAARQRGFQSRLAQAHCAWPAQGSCTEPLAT